MEQETLNITPAEMAERLRLFYIPAFPAGDPKAIITAVQKTQAFSKAMGRAGNVGTAINKFMRHVHQDAPAVGAFFIANRKKGKKNDKGEYEVTARGVSVLLSDGTPTTVWSGEHMPVETTVMERIIVGPVRIRTDIYDGPLGKVAEETGTRSAIILKESKVTLGKHEIEVPDVTVGGAVKKTMVVGGFDKDARAMADRGLIAGTAFAFATLTIGNPDEVFDNRESALGGKPSVKVSGYDSANQRIGVKLPWDFVAEQFGFDEGTDRDTIKHDLAGEPIAVNGKVGGTIPLTDRQLEPERRVVILKELGEAGLLEKVGSHKDHGDYMGLTLKGRKRRVAILACEACGEENNAGEKVCFKCGASDFAEAVREEPMVCVEVTNEAGTKFNLYNIEQQWDKKAQAVVWKFMVLATEVKKDPWMDCFEHPYEVRGEKRTNNEGAFVVFLNQMGGRSLDPNSPAAQLAKMLDEFGVTEDEKAPPADL